MTNNQDLAKKFKFLHSHIAREQHIYEVLNEISNFQEKVIKTGIGELATFEILKTSRNIKIPFNTVRPKAISNLVNILLKNYPEEIRTVITYNFVVDKDTKKLSIDEKIEFTVQLSNDELHKIQTDRDTQSTESLMVLLKQFRLFNLSKLLLKAKNRNHLSKLVKAQLGTGIFTFKNFTLDKQNLENAEDFCFHKDNYSVVKKTLNSEPLKKMLQTHVVQVNRRLKKFGILNSEFSDYSDTKLDYLLNILLEDIPTSLTPKDLTELKNFNSLRTCLLKVDKLVDPLITSASEIADYIRENGICRKTDLTAVFSNMTYDMISKWADENMDDNKLVYFKDEAGGEFFMTAEFLMNNAQELHQLVLYQDEAFSQLEYSDRQKKLSQFDFYISACRTLIMDEDKSQKVLEKEKIDTAKKIISEYDDFKKHQVSQAIVKEKQSNQESRSVSDIVIGFFKSIFSKKKKPRSTRRAVQEYTGKSHRTKISHETKNIFGQIKSNPSKVIALSHYIDLVPGNELTINTIIDDLRNLELKIVIPVYNARKKLYPNRSQKYLMSDVEYLLVDIEHSLSPEAIRDFTDSLPGEKIKDEKLPGSAIIIIEKYLLTLYRQKRALQKMKKKK